MNTTYEEGIIETISPQGDMVYAIVRRKGREVSDVDTRTVRVGTGLFRNEFNMPEEKLTLAELLIPTDIDPKTTHCDYNKFIGQSVRVRLDGGYPAFVFCYEGTSPDSRSIPGNVLQNIRLRNKDMDLSTPENIKLLKQNGFDSTTINGIINETYQSTKVKGGVISYGDVATYHKTSVREDLSEVDLSNSAKQGIVNGLPLEKLKNRLCHLHPTVLSAK